MTEEVREIQVESYVAGRLGTINNTSRMKHQHGGNKWHRLASANVGLISKESDISFVVEDDPSVPQDHVRCGEGAGRVLESALRREPERRRGRRGRLGLRRGAPVALPLRPASWKLAWAPGSG